jgi:hypothetical protein
MNSGEQPEERSRIEEMKENLYSRNAPDIHAGHRLRLKKEQYEVKSDWEHPADDFDEDVQLNQRYKKPGMSFFRKMLIASVIFFIGCVSVGVYLVLQGNDIVSANNIAINLAGPVSVEGGTPEAFTVQVQNKNSVALQVVDVTVDFPSGTADPSDPTQQLKELQQTLPDIAPGGVGQQAINAVFFGETNSQKTINVTVNYRVAGSNATFSKQEAFNVLITSSPLAVTVDSFTQINSGQNFEMDVTVSSNSKSTIDDLLLQAVYPFGYTYTSASPAPVDSANSIWNIGNLAPGGSTTIHIQGTLQGQNDATSTFTFNVGVPSSDASTNISKQTISTQYISTQQQIAIALPFVSLGLKFGNDDGSGSYVGAFDKPVEAEVSYFNNTSDAVLNGEVDVTLSGNAFDPGSVDPDNGYYDSANDEIVWNTVTDPELASIAAGAGGTLDFTFTPRNLSTAANPINDPSINVAVSAKANRTSETNVPEEVDSSVTRQVQVSSNIQLAGSIVRSTGPFTNTGPIPPKAQATTTYTVIWTVYNTSSVVDGVTVTATLPPYVAWLGQVSPSQSNIAYDPTNGQITWNIGNLQAQTAGGNTTQQQVAFQIGVNPSLTFIGQVPVTVGQATLSARDDFTGAALQSTIEQMTTSFSTDPSFVDGDEMVAGQ